MAPFIVIPSPSACMFMKLAMGSEYDSALIRDYLKNMAIVEKIDHESCFYLENATFEL